MARADDLAPLFGPGPEGPAQAMTYRQGVITAFNPITLENTVRVGGADLTNLSLLGIAEARTLAVGDVVGVMAVDKSWAILGRLVVPNTPAAAEAVSVLSANTYSAKVDTFETTTSTTYTDLATAGPTLSDVLIGPSGRCVVLISATLGNFVTASGAEMGFALSGATSLSPGDFGRSLGHYAAANIAVSGTYAVGLDGLNPGLHAFTAKYLWGGGGGGGNAGFSFRNLTVFVL